jgi:hypothetical protein
MQGPRTDEGRALSDDTQPEAEQLQIERLREMPPWRKLALVSEMNRTLRLLALAGLRQRHPDEPHAQHRRRLADLLLGPDLAARVYGRMHEADGCSQSPSP